MLWMACGAVMAEGKDKQWYEMGLCAGSAAAGRARTAIALPVAAVPVASRC